MATAPSVGSSHVHDTEGAATTTQSPPRVRTGLWSNAELEKTMVKLATDSLDLMAFDDVGPKDCIFWQLGPDGHNFAPCGKTFGDRTQRNRHAQNVHLRTLNTACEFCDNVFSRKDAVRRHVLAENVVCRVLREEVEANGMAFVKAKLAEWDEAWTAREEQEKVRKAEEKEQAKNGAARK